jgi:predicted Fe-Mo cluster-binding NifX family protein
MVLVKIGIGTTDLINVCDHLARSAAFMIVEVEGGRIVSRSVRERFRDTCGNHASFVDLLEGCGAVLCGGIGEGAATALTAHGIEPVVVAGRYPVDEATALYLAGKLPTTNARVCLCH